MNQRKKMDEATFCAEDGEGCVTLECEDGPGGTMECRMILCDDTGCMPGPGVVYHPDLGETDEAPYDEPPEMDYPEYPDMPRVPDVKRRRHALLELRDASERCWGPRCKPK